MMLFFCHSVSTVCYAIPNGNDTLVAEQFEWTVYDNNGDVRLCVYGQLNSLPYTGYGQGYMAGFKFKAQQLNSVSHGHGMMAHVDIMDPQNLDQKSFNEQYGGEFMPKPRILLLYIKRHLDKDAFYNTVRISDWFALDETTRS